MLRESVKANWVSVLKFIDNILKKLVSSLKTDHHSQKKWDSFNSDLRLLHGTSALLTNHYSNLKEYSFNSDLRLLHRTLFF